MPARRTGLRLTPQRYPHPARLSNTKLNRAQIAAQRQMLSEPISELDGMSS